MRGTSIGYVGGSTPNLSYREVCSGVTGHNEVVRVAFDPKQVSYEALLRLFRESHDPTQDMRQGNDVGPHVSLGRLLLRAYAASVRRSLPRRVPDRPHESSV